MNKRGMILVILLAGISFSLAYSQTSPGPSNPNPGPNTVTQYCYNGVCNTNMSSPHFNETIGQYAVGNYSNGISLSKSHMIGIQLSQTCIRMQEQGIPNHCLTYDELKPLDNTNPLFAGLWTDKNYPHRMAPRASNFWIGQNTTWIVMVDPTADFSTRARMITVEDNNFAWFNPDDNNTRNNQTGDYLPISTHQGRAVFSCSISTVAPNLWLVNDTLHYLESGCTKTNYNDTIVSYQKTLPLDYNSWNMKTLNWLSHFAFNGTSRLAENCIFTWSKCDIPTDPYHNHGFGWN